MPKTALTVESCINSLPMVIKIGAYDWSVVLEDNDDGLCGQAVFETSSIRVWPKNLTSPGHAVGIVLHECLHVIFDNHSLGHLKRDKEDREEQIILGFEAGLISLFRDNQKLMTWMRKWLART